MNVQCSAVCDYLCARFVIVQDDLKHIDHVSGRDDFWTNDCLASCQIPACATDSTPSEAVPFPKRRGGYIRKVATEWMRSILPADSLVGHGNMSSATNYVQS